MDKIPTALEQPIFRLFTGGFTGYLAERIVFVGGIKCQAVVSNFVAIRHRL